MECPYIPLRPYCDFSGRLHQQVIGQRIPLAGSLEVTECCNLGCVCCYKLGFTATMDVVEFHSCLS